MKRQLRRQLVGQRRDVQPDDHGGGRDDQEPQQVVEDGRPEVGVTEDVPVVLQPDPGCAVVVGEAVDDRLDRGVDEEDPDQAERRQQERVRLEPLLPPQGQCLDDLVQEQEEQVRTPDAGHDRDRDLDQLSRPVDVDVLHRDAHRVQHEAETHDPDQERLAAEAVIPGRGGPQRALRPLRGCSTLRWRRCGGRRRAGLRSAHRRRPRGRRSRGGAGAVQGLISTDSSKDPVPFGERRCRVPERWLRGGRATRRRPATAPVTAARTPRSR
jgi:hypothetical protein